MKKQLYLILPALMVAGTLSLPLSAESLTGGGGIVGSVGGSNGSAVGGATGGVSGGSVNATGNVDASGTLSKPNVAVDRPSTTNLERSDTALRSDYQAYSNRLSAVDKRIDENVRNKVYTTEQAAAHRADLSSLRARFKNKAGHIRRLSVAQRNRLDSAISDQEKRITAADNDKP